MDRCRKRPDSDPGASGEAESPADKRPCTAEETSTSAAVAASAAAAAEHAASDMDTSSSGHARAVAGAGDADGDGDDGDGDDGDADGGSSCESDGGESPRVCAGGGKFHRMVAAVAAESAGEGTLVASLTEL